MKKFKSILFFIALLVCAAVLFGCANEAPAKGSVPAGDEIEKETAADVEKEKDEAADKAPEETTAKPEETTAPPEETTAKPADTTAAPKTVETTAKPVETAKPKPVETTAKPASTTAAPVAPKPAEAGISMTAPSADVVKQMEKDYAAYMQRKYGYDPNFYGPYPVWYCYGHANGAYVLLFGGAVHTDEKPHHTTVDSYFSSGSNSRYVKVWKDGKIYTLQEAVDKGFFTEKQLNLLKENRFHEKYTTVNKPYSNVKVASVGKPEDELIKQIEADYAALNSINGYKAEASVRKYYGTYGDCVPCYFYCSVLCYIQVHCSYVTDGREFNYGDGNVIRVWRDGEFYSVQEAFDLGFLSAEDVKTISEIHQTGKAYKLEK